MFGVVRKKTIRKVIDEVKAANRKEKLYAKYPDKTSNQLILNSYSAGYEDGTDNFYNALSYELGI